MTDDTSETFEQARSSGTAPHFKILAVLAAASLCAPLLVAIALYGEWLFAWSTLGHAPRASLDDPKDIGSGVMHWVTTLALVGSLPAAVAGFALQVMQLCVKRVSIAGGALRLGLLIASWVALFALIRWDPWGVGNWWAD